MKTTFLSLVALTALISVSIFSTSVLAGNDPLTVNIQKGKAFLELNRSKDGVTETPSGLQYKVLKQGKGKTHPTLTSRVKAHYHGTLINNMVFDSSVTRGKPITFGLHQVVKGWIEGLQLMVEGDKYRFFIPSSLAYGNRAAGKIPAGSTLIFDVELLEIVK